MVWSQKFKVFSRKKRGRIKGVSYLFHNSQIKFKFDIVILRARMSHDSHLEKSLECPDLPFTYISVLTGGQVIIHL